MAEQDVGDLERIRAGIEGWLRRRWPERADLEVGALRFPEASGESSVTLILDVRHSGTDSGKLVFRMAPPASQVFEKHDLRMQFEMMRLMESEGLPAPPLVGYEPDTSIVGSDFYVMGFCEGRIPPDNPPFHAAGWVKDEATPEERATMWRTGLEVLAAIHRIPLEKIDPRIASLERLPRARSGEPLVAQELRTFGSIFKPELRRAADPLVREGWALLEARAPSGGEPALCWGDSRVGNMIFRDGRPVAVLDWEMANVSDPRTDLAWWIWIDRCNSEGLGLERLPGLPTPDDAYADWSRLTGRSLDGMAWFELFAVVRYAVILELKFAAMRAANPDFPAIANFAVPFIPDLMAAVEALDPRASDA
jgi:aminoglycoside phosphotransferase (APT) family kinase protein